MKPQLLEGTEFNLPSSSRSIALTNELSDSLGMKSSGNSSLSYLPPGQPVVNGGSRFNDKGALSSSENAECSAAMLFSELRKSVGLKSSAAVRRTIMDFATSSASPCCLDEKSLCLPPSVTSIGHNLHEHTYCHIASGTAFSFGLRTRNQTRTTVCDEDSKSASLSRVPECSSLMEEDEGIGAGELLNKLLNDVKTGASSRLKPQITILQPIPRLIPVPQPQLNPRLLRFRLPRTSVSNNCHRKQRGPLMRWWMVTQLQVHFVSMDGHDEEQLALHSVGWIHGDSNISGIIPSNASQKMLLAAVGIPVSSEALVDGEGREAEKPAELTDSGVAIQDESSDNHGSSGDENVLLDQRAEPGAGELLPESPLPVLVSLADVMLVKKRKSVRSKLASNVGTVQNLYSGCTDESDECTLQRTVVIYSGNLASPVPPVDHTHTYSNAVNMMVDDDEDDNANDSYDGARNTTVLVPAVDGPLLPLKGVSKKHFRLVRSSRLAKMLPFVGGDAFHEAKRYINRSILAAVVKNFSISQPDEFMQRCWKTIVNARSDQNIIILDAPNSCSSSNADSAMLCDSIAALRYLVPLISKRCLYELSETWTNGVGIQPKIAIICLNAADAERLARTCTRLLPRTRIALAVGLEASGHADSRRERRNMLEGAQILIVSSYSLDWYMTSWHAANDMFDEVRVIVVESAAAVILNKSRVLKNWQLQAASGKPDTPQLILVDSHSPSVGVISRFLLETRAKQQQQQHQTECAKLDGAAALAWLKVVAHPLDKLLFDNWQWEFVETAVAPDDLNDHDALLHVQERKRQLCACVQDIISAHVHTLIKSSALPSSSMPNETVLMLACYYSEVRAEQFIEALQTVATTGLAAETVRFSRINDDISETEQRVVAMRWQATRDCMMHILLVHDSCSIKTLPMLPKSSTLNITYAPCEGAIFIDLPENEADFMDRVRLLATLPHISLNSGDNAASGAEGRRVLYQFFDGETMKRAMRGSIFMLSYAQQFVAGNARSVLEHSSAIQKQLEEWKRLGPVCRQFMLTGSCLLSKKESVDAAEGAGKPDKCNLLSGCLLRHTNISREFAEPSSFLRLGQRFRFEMLWMRSPLEVVGHLEALLDDETVAKERPEHQPCIDELYEELCEELEKTVRKDPPVSADICAIGELLVAEHNHSVFRCRLVRKNMPYSIVVEDYDCTQSMDMSSGAATNSGVVMRNGYVQLPLRSTRLYLLPRPLDPKFSKKFKCFKVKLYLPSLLPKDPTGVDSSWFPSSTKVANTFFLRNKNCQIHAKASGFTDDWVCVDDIVATLAFYAVEETTHASYKKHLIDKNVAVRSETSSSFDGCANNFVV